MAKSTINSYKKGVWGEFSLYIRSRDADTNGICICCTCGKKLFWKGVECQAGHFVPGRTNNILFDESIVHAQCSHCNEYLGGNGWAYAKFMMSKYGYDYATLDEIMARKHKTRKFTIEELKQLKKQFISLRKEICKEKGLC